MIYSTEPILHKNYTSSKIAMPTCIHHLGLKGKHSCAYTYSIIQDK